MTFSFFSFRKQRSLRSRAGFTIVEVAVAATVMVLAISSALIVLQSGFKALDNARKTTLAAQIIQSEMERIRMLSWSRVELLMAASPTINLATIFPQTTEIERKVLTQMQGTFTATRTLTPLSEFGDKVIEITVTVTWKGLDGVTHNRSTSTRYSENGLYTYYYTLPS
jgi:type II secretory pathway pseudopilin PulG